MLTTFIMPITILSTWSAVTKNVKEFMVFMLILETAMVGVFLATDLFLFYIFWELVLIPMYFLIGVWGGERRIYAAIKFFLYTFVGSVLMLVAIIALYFHHHAVTGVYTMDLMKLYELTIPVKLQLWLFAAFFLAFAFKVPMFPFHTWLPDAHVEAPTAGSVILAAVLLKMGTYGFLRFAMALFPVAAADWTPLIATLAVIGIIYGALVAMVQKDVKKLVAYSSVSHLGFVMLGLFAFNLQGIEGAILQMVNHGVSTGALFLIVGIIYERRHTRLISEFGGLSRVMPIFSPLFHGRHPLLDRRPRHERLRRRVPDPAGDVQGPEMVRRRRRDRGHLRRGLHALDVPAGDVRKGDERGEPSPHRHERTGDRVHAPAAALHPLDRGLPAAVPAADGRLRERVRHALRGEETGGARRLPRGGDDARPLLRREEGRRAMMPIPFDQAALVQGLYSILPELVVIATAIAVLLADLALPERGKKTLCHLGIAGTAVAILATLWLGLGRIDGFSGMIVHDGMGLFITLTILVTTLLTLLMATGYSEWEGTQKGEFYALLLFSTAGMLFMAKGTDLMTVFLGLETMSIPIYCLVGFHRNRMTSLEGALKYFLLGAFASGFLLYGIALMYSVTGTTKIPAIAGMIGDLRLSGNPVFMVGVGLLLAGFAFKVSLVPFHMWTPDAYQGAPTVVTAFMAAGVKAAAFAALLRVTLLTFPALGPVMTNILWVLAFLTMTVGNLSALLQDNLKRMLAYSSIAHAGYILVGIVAGDVAGAQAALFYLLVYAFMNLGAFGVAMLLAHKEDDGYDIGNFKGIGFRYPVLGGLLTLFLVSLAGIPPTAGFIGKFYLFSAAVKNGYVGLAVLGVLNSAVSIYYYLRPVVYMYMLPAPAEIPVPRPPRTAFSLALCISAAAVLVLGIAPHSVLAFAERSILSLLM